jgi:hypothetical protein
MRNCRLRRLCQMISDGPATGSFEALLGTQARPSRYMCPLPQSAHPGRSGVSSRPGPQRFGAAFA